jgi:hypothetical protein
MRLRGVLLALACAAGLVVPASSTAVLPKQFVLSPEGNHLWAYDSKTRAHQLVYRAQNGSNPGELAPAGSERRDINGQICVSPDQRHFISGEDTVIPPPGGGGSSHDPRIAGWGYHEISGNSLGSIFARQVGKLAPEAGEGPGYTGDPDNFGCGFLDNNRIVTSAIGDTLPGQPANGQLFLWFGPFDAGFRQEAEPSGVKFFVGEVPHCQIDDTLATAGGIAVDDNGDVYVATNRPNEDFTVPSGIWRYRGRWPTSMAECTPEFLAANVHKKQIIPHTKGLLFDLFSPTPSAVVISPDDTLYVSSVFTGTVSEYTKAGIWVRDIYPFSPIAPRSGPTGKTPFGLAVTADGALWIADLGIFVAEPINGQGSLIRVGFTENRDPGLRPKTVRSGLTFPDGLGVYTPPS